MATTSMNPLFQESLPGSMRKAQAGGRKDTFLSKVELY
ncbi:uncharacterized protein METZ01_LOCUS215423 [marine metagenome]|uniref:Uncharacterized protein n=1 Tax=marine metagenome TaxID=408172 RepID=A0A382FIS6_9ZZZZ